MDITSGNIGSEGKYSIDINNGTLELKVSVDGQDGGANLIVYVKPSVFIDKLESQHPGTLINLALDLLKSAIG